MSTPLRASPVTYVFPSNSFLDIPDITHSIVIICRILYREHMSTLVRQIPLEHEVDPTGVSYVWLGIDSDDDLVEAPVTRY